MYAHGGSCWRLPSLKTRLRSTPTPSKTPRRIPHATADPNAALGPPAQLKKDINDSSSEDRGKALLRAAKHPPVMNPEIIAFHASSFCRYPFTAQSNVENIPPHTPKFPPVTGARALITEMAPTSLSP